MRERIVRRIILAATIIALAAAITIWLTRQRQQLTLNSDLITAIKQSNSQKVDSLLAAGADPNARDTPQLQKSILDRLHDLLHPRPPALSPTAVIITVTVFDNDPNQMNSTCRIINALHSKGADMNASDKDGNTPISEIFWDQKRDGVKGTTISFFQVRRNAPQLLECLIKGGAKIDANAIQGETTLATAALFNEAEVARVLLEHGANPSTPDKTGKPHLCSRINPAEIPTASSTSLNPTAQRIKQ